MNFRTLCETFQNGADVDVGLVVRVEFSPAVPVLEAVSQFVVFGDAAEQRHHPVRRVEESVQRSVQVGFTQHVHEGPGDQHHDAAAALEAVEVVPVEPIVIAERVQQNGAFAKLLGGRQDEPQIRGPFMGLGRVQN